MSKGKLQAINAINAIMAGLAIPAELMKWQILKQNLMHGQPIPIKYKNQRQRRKLAAQTR